MTFGWEPLDIRQSSIYQLYVVWIIALLDMDYIEREIQSSILKKKFC